MASLPLSAPNDESAQRLPPELIQLILEHLRSDPETLRQTALVSKQWLPTSRVHLFNHVCLSAPRRDSTRTPCSLLHEALSESPEIAYYIRHVSILAGSAEWANAHPRARWIVSEDTLPALLHILARSSRVESVQIRLSGEHWHELPEPLQRSILTLIDSPSMRDVDFYWVRRRRWRDFRAMSRHQAAEALGGWQYSGRGCGDRRVACAVRLGHCPGYGVRRGYHLLGHCHPVFLHPAGSAARLQSARRHHAGRSPPQPCRRYARIATSTAGLRTLADALELHRPQQPPRAHLPPALSRALRRVGPASLGCVSPQLPRSHQSPRAPHHRPAPRRGPRQRARAPVGGA
ncbi:hypothetical protein C8R44DRAFT_345802 [Mycena epipterygia]|nr:hypothetical protein C8R44DRAFT_345802 [Mycena epipterygia]